MAVTVLNLADVNDTQTFIDLDPTTAVCVAHARSIGEDTTGDVVARYASLITRAEHTVVCGNFGAYYCNCHPWEF